MRERPLSSGKEVFVPPVERQGLVANRRRLSASRSDGGCLATPPLHATEHTGSYHSGWTELSSHRHIEPGRPELVKASVTKDLLNNSVS